MSTLTVTISDRSTKGQSGVEGSYQLPGSTKARLAQKDGKTLFPNRGSLSQAARRLAATLGWKAELVDPTKKIAKKATKRTKRQAAPAIA